MASSEKLGGTNYTAERKRERGSERERRRVCHFAGMKPCICKGRLLVV